MTREDRPPRFARAVLRRVVPDLDADVAEGELGEAFRAYRERVGLGAARRWYRRQVWGYVWRAIAVRRSTARRGEDGMARLSHVGADVRWAVRSLRKRPAFTAVAVATLALGIGANSAIFTLVHAYFFEALPYDRPDELVLLWETDRNSQDVTTVAPGNYWTWRDEAGSFADIAAYNVDFATLSGDGPAEGVSAGLVVPHFFDVLGAEPLLGSGFEEAAVRAADGSLVVLSHSLWTRRYGADPSLVGRDIRVDGRPYTVVGVMPPDFRQPERSLSWQTTELWRPLLLEAQRSDFGGRFLRTVARRRAGVTVEQARIEMEAMARRMAEAYPQVNGGRSILVRTLDEYLLADARPTLLMLVLAGAAVLLIVCANVANLTLARGEERRREFAVRAALGSGGARLVRQVVVEGVVLALIAAVVGTACVYAASDILQAIQARFFSSLIDISVDARVIGVTTMIAVAAGALFGLPLARSASRADPGRALREGGARGGSARSDATRNLLIVSQVSIATGLLVVAALLVRSFAELVDVPPGFEPRGVVSFSVSPPVVGYEDRDAIVRYHRELTAEVEATPGVAEVGLVSDLMFTTENRWTNVAADGRPVDPESALRAEHHTVMPSYFGTVDIPVVAGALPDARVEGEEIPVAVNERMASTLWPDGSAIGSLLTPDWTTPATLRVVAIVGDVLDDGYDAVAEPTFYLPFSIRPSRRMAYVVRTAGDPSQVLPALREAVARVDADVPTEDLQLLSDMMAESVSRPRAAFLMGLAFACIALLVAAAGIYGVLSYAVQRRTREIGIRSALGASGADLVSMVMGHSTRLVIVGLVVGSVGAVAAGRALSGLLFGIRSWDPISLIGAALLLGTVASLAAWIPARRAVAIDPREALRAE